MSAYPKPQPPQMHEQFAAQQSDNAAEGPHEGITRKESKPPDQRPSPPKPEPDQLTDAATISYGYPLAAHQAVVSSYDAVYTSNDSMIGPCHPSSYAADYPPTAIHHATITRRSITTLPMPMSSAPQLIRTSTIQTSGSSSPSQMKPYAMYSAKANLKINGDLEAMASNWTQEEWENRRRIVMFNRKQQGSTLSTSFKPVTVSETTASASAAYSQDL
ncbi:Uu.00g137230.m01.CDS01 [Anthostomella pinea]|uniref:Uu.00g137230.m01.CDS01 n=1 Tax=Anthostomella pinea TaxID=933095 RepID=A0AAI8VQP1_9PEZI|nr:Uu.00g137230.m01.CDS01 [Anthostomella pinea]